MVSRQPSRGVHDSLTLVIPDWWRPPGGFPEEPGWTPPTTKRVMLVEDNPKHLALYVRQLAQENYDVVPAATAEEALERMTDDIRTVVTDM